MMNLAVEYITLCVCVRLRVSSNYDLVMGFVLGQIVNSVINGNGNYKQFNHVLLGCNC